MVAGRKAARAIDEYLKSLCPSEQSDTAPVSQCWGESPVVQDLSTE
jgi:hypothetical protein